MANLTPAEVYRHEAERLRAQAGSAAFLSMRGAFLEIAERYEVLARQAEGLQPHKAANAAPPRLRAANQGD